MFFLQHKNDVNMCLQAILPCQADRLCCLLFIDSGILSGMLKIYMALGPSLGMAFVSRDPHLAGGEIGG